MNDEKGPKESVLLTRLDDESVQYVFKVNFFIWKEVKAANPKDTYIKDLWIL